MPHHTTCWTMIQGAADGVEDDRRMFADRYAGTIRAYLLARWQSSPLRQEIDDAIQEVFVESFRPGGALSRVDPERAGKGAAEAGEGGGFRAFFYGVVRNVALRHESRQARDRAAQPPPGFLPEGVSRSEEQLSRLFDRAWAQSIMREAAERQHEQAREKGSEAQERLELLRLRFHEGMPIREIARIWDADPAQLHREYARARQEFRQALLEVVAFHHPSPQEALEQECAHLLSMLGS